MKQPVPIDTEMRNKTEQLRAKIKENMEQHDQIFSDTKPRNEKNIDEMAEILHKATIDAITTTFPYTKTVTIKQDYITNEVWGRISNRQQRWKDILDHAIKPKLRNLVDYTRRTFQALKLYAAWHREKRETQKQVHEAKRKHLDNALKKVSEGNSLQTIRDRHKLLRQFAPKPRGQIQQIKTNNGKYAHTTEQETQAYDEMIATIWEGERLAEHDIDNRSITQPDIHKQPKHLDVTTADVISAYRKCKTRKAMKTGTRPAEALHMAADITAPYEKELWKTIAYQRRIPQQWALSDVTLLPKPGKDPSTLTNRRAINKIDSGLKAYSTYIQRCTAPLIQKESVGEWGGLQHKGIRQPLLIVETMIQRAKRVKIDLALFAGDIDKAFDSADHEKLAEALPQFIPHPDYPCLIEDRHNSIYFRFQLSDRTEVIYRIPKGAVQGCSLGPLAFTLYYRSFLRHLASQRTDQQHKIMEFQIDPQRIYRWYEHDDKTTYPSQSEHQDPRLCQGPADSDVRRPNNNNIQQIQNSSAQQLYQTPAPHWMNKTNMHSLTFVDDHFEMWATKSANEIRQIFQPFVESQKTYKLTTNFKKTQIAIVPRGRQAKKRIASFGGKFKINKGEFVQLTNQITYLGSIITTNGSSAPAVQHRITLAKSSHARLTPKVYRSRIYPMKMKIELYKQHELTVLLSGLDTKVLSLQDIDKLERFQMRSIRHIAQSQSHITKETNHNLRRRLNVPTVTSKLQVQRLRMLKDIFTYPTANQQVLAVLFGTVQWDQTTPTTNNSPQIKQLWHDIEALWFAKHKNTMFENTPIPMTWSRTYIDRQMQKWLIDTSSTTMNKLLTFENIRDKQQYRQQELNPEIDHDILPFPCLQCDKTYRTKHALSVHTASAHKTRNPLRAQVTTSVCPGCEKQFTNTINAQRHWSKQICARNGTAKYTTEQVQERISNTTTTPQTNISAPITIQGRTIAELVRLLFRSSNENQSQPSQADRGPSDSRGANPQVLGSELTSLE